MGCDAQYTLDQAAERDFNPRTPCGVRHCTSWAGFVGIKYFNPRTPCGVRHARVVEALTEEYNFNPRTPCGVRRAIPSQSRWQRTFQSTHPVWGATSERYAGTVDRYDFNPRTPCGVRLETGITKKDDRGHFNPRTPCGVRPPELQIGVDVWQISIHAPRVGCDRLVTSLNLVMWLFQSTHPVWGATGGKLTFGSL